MKALFLSIILLSSQAFAMRDIDVDAEKLFKAMNVETTDSKGELVKSIGGLNCRLTKSSQYKCRESDRLNAAQVYQNLKVREVRMMVRKSIRPTEKYNKSVAGYRCTKIIYINAKDKVDFNCVVEKEIESMRDFRPDMFHNGRYN